MIADRRDLAESLEAYAARVDVPVRDLRATWRREGLRLLHVPGYEAADVHSGLCLVAPGTPVATAYVDWPDELPGEVRT